MVCMTDCMRKENHQGESIGEDELVVDDEDLLLLLVHEVLDVLELHEVAVGCFAKILRASSPSCWPKMSNNSDLR